MDLFECGFLYEKRIMDINWRMDEDFLRVYSDDGFQINNPDAFRYVSRNKDIDFMNLLNFFDV